MLTVQMMTLEELRNLLVRGESDVVAFKQSTSSLSDALKTFCGMLNNGRSGVVVFGVNDKRQIIGQDVSTRTLENIAQELRKIEPAVHPTIDTIPLENERVVIALLVPLINGLFRYDGRPYSRLGPTTSVMPYDLFAQRLMEDIQTAHRWETWPAHGFSVHDLDEQEIVRTIDEAIRRQRLADPGTRNPTELLIGMGLLDGDRPLNAAVVLFGRPGRLLPHFPQCLVRLARFRGRTKSEFIDNRQEVGNAFDIFIRAQRFLQDHLPVAGRIVPNLFERIDDPLYPPEALRCVVPQRLQHQRRLNRHCDLR